MAQTLTPTGTNFQISTSSSFDTLLNTDTGVYRTSETFAENSLPYGVNLYMRVRHTAEETGTSAWSNTVKFQFEIPSRIIGVCMKNDVASAKGVFYWIDANGNQLQAFDWANHPTYSAIKNVTMDSSRAPVTLTAFPLFYVKTAASGPAGSFANGYKCWWISNKADTGFRPAACFKRSTSNTLSDWCYMGTYLGHSETVGGKTCIGSKLGQTVAGSQTKAAFKSWITNRNNTSAGQTGWRMFDIWDLGALRMLLLIAKADSDTQTVWGDNSAGTAYPKTGSTNARAVFQGTHTNPLVRMDDLWHCYWYHADLITIASGVVTLTDPRDLTTALTYGSSTASRYTQPTASGWIRDVLDCPLTIGNDTHDLLELFLPKTVVSAENQGTFSDHHDVDHGAGPILAAGGRFGHDGGHDGIFFSYPIRDNAVPEQTGSRLSKT